MPHENESLNRFFEPDGDWQESSKPPNRNLNDDSHLLDNDEFLLVMFNQ